MKKVVLFLLVALFFLDLKAQDTLKVALSLQDPLFCDPVTAYNDVVDTRLILRDKNQVIIDELLTTYLPGGAIASSVNTAIPPLILWDGDLANLLGARLVITDRSQPYFFQSNISHTCGGSIIQGGTNSSVVQEDYLTTNLLQDDTLILSREDGTLDTFDLKPYVNPVHTPSSVTNTIAGNLIGTHDNGDATIVNINETITTSSLISDTLYITHEGGTIDTFDLKPYAEDDYLADNGISKVGSTFKLGHPASGSGVSDFTANRFLYTGAFDLETRGTGGFTYFDGSVGRLGINTATPSSSLSNVSASFDDATTGTSNVSINWNTATTATGYAAGIRNEHSSGSGLLIQGGQSPSSASRLLHVTSSDAGKTTRFLVRGDGRVGIAIASPQGELHVNGRTYFGNAGASSASMFTYDGTAYSTPLTTGRNFSFWTETSSGVQAAFSLAGGGNTQTTGTYYEMYLPRQFTPASGSATYTWLYLIGQINQNPSCTGITRGIHANQNLTNAIDYRAIEISNNSHKGLWQTGASAVNHFNGNVGFGITAPTEKVHVTGNAKIVHDSGGNTYRSDFTTTGHSFIHTAAGGQFTSQTATTATTFIKSEIPSTHNGSLTIANNNVQIFSDNLTNTNQSVFNVGSTSGQLQTTDGTNTGEISTSPTTVVLTAATGSINFNGTEKPLKVLKTTNYTIVKGDNTILANSGSAISIFLPAAPADGDTYKVGSIGTGTLTFDGNGKNIGLVATLTIPQGELMEVIYDSTFNAWVKYRP